MQGGAEACSNAEILLSMTFTRVNFNAGRGRSPRYGKTLALSDKKGSARNQRAAALHFHENLTSSAP
jgi:hypothetical protein